MSLLHQVLRDIDKRAMVPAAIPLLTTHTVNHSSLFMRILPLVLLVVVLGLMVSLQLNHQPSATEVIPLMPESLSSAAQHNMEVSEHSTIDFGITDANKQHAGPGTENMSVPEAAEKIAAVSAASVVTVTTPTGIAADLPAPVQLPQQLPQQQISQPVQIVRRTTPARDFYMQALAALQSGQLQRALQQTEQALLSDTRVEYLTLKLRILLELNLEQSNTGEFLTFFHQHQALQDEHWLAVAAPGLHMLGYVTDAVVPYQQLIVLQPAVTNWPLALATAWETQNKPIPARAVLENTLQHYSLTPAQRQWTLQKIQQLR